MALLSIASRDGRQAFAVVADNDQAQYVFTPGREVPGLDDERVLRLVDRRQPGDALGWLQLLGTNIGYFTLGPPFEFDTYDEALAEAQRLLSIQEMTQ